jgi:hypothetical protein
MLAIAPAHLESLKETWPYYLLSAIRTLEVHGGCSRLIEGLVALGEQSEAAPFYPLARELIGTGAVVLWPVLRFTQTIAGVAAAAARHWEAAEEHFQIAMQQAESYPISSNRRRYAASVQ